MGPPTPQQQTSQLLFTPLMICMVGIVSTALAILLYHIILNKFCVRRRVHSAIVRLSEQNGKANGVEDKVLASIPIHAYSVKQVELFGVDQIECAVCLSELEEGEMVRLLPTCQHVFHVQCIDEWFLSHSNCPVCRSPIVAPDMLVELPVAIDIEISHGDEDRGNDHVDGVDAPDRRAGSNFLQKSVSVELPHNESKSSLPLKLRRSASMDYTYISLKIQQAKEDIPSSSSSSSSSPSSATKAGMSRSSSYKIGSFRSLDRASLALKKSYSRLWSSNNSTTEGMLPR